MGDSTPGSRPFDRLQRLEAPLVEHKPEGNRSWAADGPEATLDEIGVRHR